MEYYLAFTFLLNIINFTNQLNKRFDHYLISLKNIAIIKNNSLLRILEDLF